MSYSDTRSRYLLAAKIIVIVAALGLAIMIYANIGDNPTHLAYSLIAFIISAAALVVTILQSLSIARQVQITQRAAREIRETGELMASLIKDDERLAQEIHQDIELDREIISVLEEYGIGVDEHERHRVAKGIAKRLHER